MGAWGAGPFDNDTACDWLCELEESDLELVRESLAVSAADASDGSVMISAAEIVACLRGHPPDGELPEEVTGFVARGDKADDELVESARVAVDRVAGSDSELRELWEESESYDEWRAAVADLKRRLHAK